MHRLCSLLGLLFLVNLLYSQSKKYMDGYYINQNGEAIEGKILIENNANLLKIITAKTGQLMEVNFANVQFIHLATNRHFKILPTKLKNDQD